MISGKEAHQKKVEDYYFGFMLIMFAICYVLTISITIALYFLIRFILVNLIGFLF